MTDRQTDNATDLIYIRHATRLGYIPMKSGNVADLSYPTSKIRRDRVQGRYGNISPTITCGGNAIYKIDREIEKMDVMTDEFYQDNQDIGSGKKKTKKKYRIRKLTPKECFRLQGVSEKDADAMLNTESNSQCYKAAGNSICVSVLCALFSQLGIQGIPRWNDMNNEERKQMIYKGTILERKSVDEHGFEVF